ncbi:MAG: alpha/beta fold hydrolase [Oscillospiraceae bacterium]|nr:alpha/beta fold hydrolase [Oscillospiraceae bacterium]
MITTHPKYKQMSPRDLQYKLMLPDNRTPAQYIIALHGFGGSMESGTIAALAERLTAHETAVLAFNLPGHGSDTQAELFSVQNCIRDFQDAAGMMQTHCPDAAWRGVFATSFGGYIALNALPMIPDSVRIVLRAPAVNMADVFARIVSEHCTMQEYARSGSIELGFSRKIKVPFAFYRELQKNDVFTQDHDREMLLIHGGSDEVVLPADTDAFCKRNPKIRQITVAGAKHRLTDGNEMQQVVDAAAEWLLR